MKKATESFRFVLKENLEVRERLKYEKLTRSSRISELVECVDKLVEMLLLHVRQGVGFATAVEVAADAMCRHFRRRRRQHEERAATWAQFAVGLVLRELHVREERVAVGAGLLLEPRAPIARVDGLLVTLRTALPVVRVAAAHRLAARSVRTYLRLLREATTLLTPDGSHRETRPEVELHRVSDQFII